MMEAINDLLDRLPTTTFGSMSREVPAYRTCGVIGYYAALIVSLAVVVIAGGSPLVMASVAAVCGLSFFAWAYLRRWLGRGEKIVLLEHVWFALVCSAGLLAWLGETPLPYLDAVAVALPVFLACGRVGCFLAGCCFGRPSRVGVTYGADHVRTGFPAHLLGIRVFPVPLVEALGLLLVALGGGITVLLGRPGAATVWFLVSYAVIRFGLEGLRGDRRSFFLGLSTNRWMCLGQFGVALLLGELLAGRSLVGRHELIIALGFVLLLAGALTARALTSPRRELLDRRHVEELSALIDARLGCLHPEGASTSLGVSIAVPSSRAATGWHVSFAMPTGVRDLETLCEMASDSLHGRPMGVVHVSAKGVLHLMVGRRAVEAGQPTGSSRVNRLDLYSRAVGNLQANRVARDGQIEGTSA